MILKHNTCDTLAGSHKHYSRETPARCHKYYSHERQTPSRRAWL